MGVKSIDPASAWWCQTIAQGSKVTTDAQEAPPEYEEEPLYCACDQTLEQIAQRGFRVSLMGDIQKPGDVF